jgi:hypothetical protein
MISKLVMSDNARCDVVRAGNKTEDQLPLRGVFMLEHWRDGKLIDKRRICNLITDEGKNKLLDVMFHGVTAIGTWYIGLVDNAGFSAVAAGDTYAQIGGTNGWDEFTAYTEASRQEWTEGAAASKSITNSSPVVFNINSSGVVYGLFVAGGAEAATKSDNTVGNTLWSAVGFSGGAVTVGNGDQLKVTYTVSA